MAAPFRAVFGRALDVALPTLCPACREQVRDSGLCAPCWSKLSMIAPPYCERLGIPFAYDPGPGVLSMQAIADPPAYHRARAAVRYDDIARALVHALKYGDRIDLAPTMGRWMARAGRELLEDADALIPVPLHWRRLWARRFNQSALLAKAISRETGVAVADTALKRVKATAQQVGLTAEPSAPQMCRARSACRRTARPRWPAAARAGRRRADLGRHLRRLRAGAAAGRRPQRRPRGVRAGCRRGASPHINWLSEHADSHANHAMPPVEIYTTPYCPYCHRRQGASEEEERRRSPRSTSAATASCAAR